MLLVVGYVVVVAATLGGFMIAGGNPLLLLHVSEFVVIGGIAAGILVIASPQSVLKSLFREVLGVFTDSGIKREEYIDLLKLLYELFLLGRRNGLIALDEHVTTPESSVILSKYPSFLKDKARVDFLCNGLRPIIDGKIKPDQLEELLEVEIETKEDEVKGPLKVLNLVGDSLPGVGIIAAVLGIINTMAAIAEGPESVGRKVAAALTGTFLGILGAYGFVNPLHQRLTFNHQASALYFSTIARSVAGFAKGLAPIMALEIARRSLEKSVQPDADELEATLKSLNSKSGG